MECIQRDLTNAEQKISVHLYRKHSGILWGHTMFLEEER